MTSDGSREMVDVVVKLPATRLGDFYEMFGRWLQGEGGRAAPHESDATAGADDARAWDPHADLDLAAAAWRRFPERAKAMFGTLIDHPGREFSGDELADMHEIPNGRSGVAGVLAHPGRQLKKIGRKHHFTYTTDDAGVGRFSMTPEMAALFDRARHSAGD